MANELKLVVRSPAESRWGEVELRVLVDGRDVVAEVFEAGANSDPDYLLGAESRLMPGEHSREVLLAEAYCTEGCCGSVSVRVRREGDEIVWDDWSDPQNPELVLESFQFDAERYLAEIARADRDREWEWPGRTIGRLMRAAVEAEPELFGSWNSDLYFVRSPPTNRQALEVVFFSPPKATIDDFYEMFGSSLTHRQYRLTIPITEARPTDQVRVFVEALRRLDPREYAEICGGSGGIGRAMAEQQPPPPWPTG